MLGESLVGMRGFYFDVMEYNSSVRSSLLLIIAFAVVNCGKKAVLKETFPFSTASRVDVVAYPNRFAWDTTSDENGMHVDEGVIADGRLRLPQQKIRDRITLNQAQIKRAFELLYNDDCSSEEAAACYDPRHALIFFDKNSKAIAAIEICLDCYKARVTTGVPRISFCGEKVADLATLFRSFGVKYFGQDEQVGDAD